MTRAGPLWRFAFQVIVMSDRIGTCSGALGLTQNIRIDPDTRHPDWTNLFKEWLDEYENYQPFDDASAA
jgi:hypothetical protein